MTLQGWDASHFDGPLSRSTLDRAYAEGIRFFTHKVGEGLVDTEGTLDDTALAAARDAGIPFLAPYFIPRSNAKPADQVAQWMKLLNAGEPWWRDFPGMFVQSDLERWPYDSVPASVGIECTYRIRDAMDRVAILYASRGQYGDQLTAWDGPLWNADYRGGPGYPGDGWVAADKGAAAGWAPYSGKAPAILQYTSSATIAGLTTCDANAFRGTVADFATMIGGKAMAFLDDPAGAILAFRVEGIVRGYDKTNETDARNPMPGEDVWIVQAVKDLQAKVGATPAVDLTEAQLAAIADQVAAKLGAQLADTATKVDQLLARLTAAGDALDG